MRPGALFVAAGSWLPPLGFCWRGRREQTPARSTREPIRRRRGQHFPLSGNGSRIRGGVAADAYVCAPVRQGAEMARIRPWYRADLVPVRRINDDETAARHGLGRQEREFLRGPAGALVYENA